MCIEWYLTMFFCLLVVVVVDAHSVVLRWTIGARSDSMNKPHFFGLMGVHKKDKIEACGQFHFVVDHFFAVS